MKKLLLSALVAATIGCSAHKFAYKPLPLVEKPFTSEFLQDTVVINRSLNYLVQQDFFSSSIDSLITSKMYVNKPVRGVKGMNSDGKITFSFVFEDSTSYYFLEQEKLYDNIAHEIAHDYFRTFSVDKQNAFRRLVANHMWEYADMLERVDLHVFNPDNFVGAPLTPPQFMSLHQIYAKSLFYRESLGDDFIMRFYGDEVFANFAGKQAQTHVYCLADSMTHVEALLIPHDLLPFYEGFFSDGFLQSLRDSEFFEY